MSHQLISRSPDLLRLKDEGYEIEVRGAHLIVHGVPYVNAKCEVRRGVLVATLSLAGDKTTRPETHVAMFSGETPCDKSGAELKRIINSNNRQNLGDGLITNHTFSSKPKCGYYKDYYELVSTYVAILCSQAETIEPSATARTFRVVENHDQNSLFQYVDTASDRAGTTKLAKKLELDEVAIVGVGGTGSYILDLIAKTPIKKISLFDGDTFLQHNAFRSPGAPSVQKLEELPLKVDYWKRIYSQMHRGIVANGFKVDGSNASALMSADFVFLCMDGSNDKQELVRQLEAFKTDFIDVGMGLEFADDCLVGTIRTTMSTSDMREHVHERDRIPFSEDGDARLYSHNIQVADLNMLNAAMAVVKWKKRFGFYCDLEHEHFSTYQVDGNHILNEDKT